MKTPRARAREERRAREREMTKAFDGPPKVGDVCPIPWEECPKGHKMVVRKRGGGGPKPFFLGCSKYPRCKEIRDIRELAMDCGFWEGGEVVDIVDVVRFYLWTVYLLDRDEYDGQLAELALLVQDHLQVQEDDGPSEQDLGAPV